MNIPTISQMMPLRMRREFFRRVFEGRFRVISGWPYFITRVVRRIRRES